MALQRRGKDALQRRFFVCELLGYVFQAIRPADTTDAIHVNNDHKMPGETRITSKSTACLKVETAETNVQKACTKQSDLRLISCKKRIQAPSERRMQSITLILMASERKLGSSQAPGRKRRKEIFFSCIAERARDMVGQLLEIRKRSETVIECRIFTGNTETKQTKQASTTQPTPTKPASENSQKR